jgi:2-polyprenyl-6-methoxyphenol hydroxylase-like FAD-dependent oxidoreductase
LNDERVMIIGAGLSGLAAANALRNAGIETTVFERAPELLPVGAIIGVAANAARGLERIGLGHIVEQSCIPVQRLEYVDWRGKPLTHMPIGEVAKDLGTRTFIALRADVQAGLAAALGPGTIELGNTCIGFEQDESGVTARIEGGREERGSALLGADGLHSVVRGQLHGDRPRYSGYSGWRGVTEVDPTPLSPGLGRQVLGRGRTFGAFGLRDRQVYWWASAKMEEGRGDSEAGRKQDVRATFDGAPTFVQTIVEATDEKNILRNDIFDQPLLDTWGTGRVTLVGDAGHATTPNTGEGGSHAILDGVLVAEQLSGAGSLDRAAVDSALRAFEAEAIPRTSDVIKRSREIGNFLHFDNPLMCRIRDLVFYKATPQRIWRKRAAVYLEAAR